MVNLITKMVIMGLYGDMAESFYGDFMVESVLRLSWVFM